MGRDRVEELEKRIADLKKRWPAHSVSAALMEQLDELEEELQREREKIDESSEDIENHSPSIYLCAIGYVENQFNEPTAPDEIRPVESRLVIDPSLVDGLQGFEPGRQIMVIFHFHRAKGYSLLQHPRGDQSRPKRGVFTLNSPNRPNPIGVTVVDLVAIEGNVLRVRGLDAIHGTPVLDLKPA